MASRARNPTAPQNPNTGGDKPRPYGRVPYERVGDALVASRAGWSDVAPESPDAGGDKPRAYGCALYERVGDALVASRG